MKTFINIIKGAFIILLILLSVMIVLPFLHLSSSYKIFTVQTGSMTPAIPKGSLILTKSLSDYEVGDVITFHASPNAAANDVPTTHRIEKIEETGQIKSYTTKGDANETDDKNDLRYSQIEGKVVFHLPFIGYFINFIRTPLGFLFIVLVPAIIIVNEEVRNIIASLKKPKKERAIDKATDEKLV